MPKDFESNFRGGNSLVKNDISEGQLLEKRVCKAVNFWEVLRGKRAEYAIIDLLLEHFQGDGETLIEFNPRCLNICLIRRSLSISSNRWT